MKKFPFLMMVVLLMGLCYPFANTSAQGDYIFPLEELNLNSNGDLNSYDAATHTITFGGDWQFYGWTWENEGGKDFSIYSSITIAYDASGIPAGNPDDPTKIQIEVAYMEGEPQVSEVRVINSSGTVALDPERKDRVKYVFIKSQAAGELILTKAWATSIYSDYDLSLDALNLNSNGDLNSYDAATHTITYGGDWQFYGWTWEAQGGMDFSAYKSVTIAYDAKDIPLGNPDDPTKIQIEVGYMEGEPVNTEVRVINSSGTVELDPERKSAVKYIFIKSQAAGKLVLTDAYVSSLYASYYLALDALNLNSNGDLNSYDAATHTITYGGDWQFYGWTWEEQGGIDFSGYKSVKIDYDAAGIPLGNPDDPTKIQIEVGYMTGDPVNTEVRVTHSSGTVELDPERKSAVKYIFIKSQAAGELVLTDAYLLAVLDEAAEDYLLPLANNEDLSYGSDSSYDAATQTITFDGEWKSRGWLFDPESEVDFAAYDYAIVEFEPVAYQVKLITEYNGDIEATSTLVEAGASRVVVELDAAGKTSIKQIYLQAATAGQLKLVKAYLSVKDPRRPDLIVTDIIWEPVTPNPGEEIIFSAKIKNIGDAPTPVNVKHGVAFAVNGATVTWSDTYKGADKFLMPGEETILVASGGTKGEAFWKSGNNATYSIRAHVNDNPNDGIKNESNTDNNTMTKVMTMAGNIDLAIQSLNWRPTNPAEDDEVIFNVVVKNIGTLATPLNSQITAKFYINNELVTWNESTFTSLAADASTRITADNGAEEVEYWIAGAGTYTVKVVINDGQSIEESDYANNTFEAQLIIQSTDINETTIGGSVFTRDNRLYAEGYSVDATAVVYDLSGRELARYNSVSQLSELTLATGTYMVQVVKENKIELHKVLVK